MVVLKGLGFALLATLLWSGNYIVARALHKSIPPVSLAFFRWLMATIILFPLAFRMLQRDYKVLLRHLPYLCFTALTGVTLFNTFIYVAGKYTSAINLALIGTTAAPVFVLIITAFILKQKILWNQVIGALICIVGIITLLTKGALWQLNSFQLSISDSWIFAAALSFAIYTVLVRKVPKELSPLSFLLAVFFLGTLLLLPAYIVEQYYVTPFEWTRSLFFIFLYLGLGASVISFLSWNLAIKAIGPARTALFGNLIPVFSTIEAALILNEDLNWITLLSLLIILIGLIMANLKLVNNLLFRRQ